MTIKSTTETAHAKRKQVPPPQNANLFRPCGRNSLPQNHLFEDGTRGLDLGQFHELDC